MKWTEEKLNNEKIKQLTQYAHKAVLYEVLLSPKPGLVDRNNTGAHDDMDLFTFIDAITALTPYFYEYTALGENHDAMEPPTVLFQKARDMGFKAEVAMMQATNQVNTHKGANFSFAVILAASAYLTKEEQITFPFTTKDTEHLFHYVSLMCAGLVTADFKDLEKKEHLSYGENLYQTYGISGIRGVAEDGYPILTEVLLPYLRQQLKKFPQNQEGVLLHNLALTMSAAEDTNLIHRGGIKAFHQVRQEAKEIYESNTPATIAESFKEYDQLLIERHLSPGGAADLLSLAIYVAQLEGLL